MLYMSIVLIKQAVLMYISDAYFLHLSFVAAMSANATCQYNVSQCDMPVQCQTMRHFSAMSDKASCQLNIT